MALVVGEAQAVSGLHGLRLTSFPRTETSPEEADACSAWSHPGSEARAVASAWAGRIAILLGTELRIRAFVGD